MYLISYILFNIEKLIIFLGICEIFFFIIFYVVL